VACGEELSETDLKCTKCGHSVTVTDTPSSRVDSGDVVLSRLRTVLSGNFSVKRELGRGGQAQVYLAEDRALERQVAIKVLSQFTGAKDVAIQRLRLEARTVASFQHPHIVKLFAVQHYDDLHLLIMQYLGGRPLADMLRTNGTLPLSVTLTVMHQIGSALEYAHGRGVVHRDIKPANVLFDGEGNAVLTDFGLAKPAWDTGITQTNEALGSVTYMSPEQCFADAVSPASDQYAMGVMLYEMLIGEPPYRGTEMAVMQGHVDGRIPSIRDRRPDCPASVDQAVQRMLGKTAEQRFPSVGAALAAIGATEVADTPNDRERLRQWVFAEERSSGRILTPTLGSIAVTPRADGDGAETSAPGTGTGIGVGATARPDRSDGKKPTMVSGEARASSASTAAPAVSADGHTSPDTAAASAPAGSGGGEFNRKVVAGLVGGVLVAAIAAVGLRSNGSTPRADSTETVAHAEQQATGAQGGAPPIAETAEEIAAEGELARGIVGLRSRLDHYLSDDQVRDWRNGKVVDSSGRVLPNVPITYAVENKRIARIDGEVLVLLDTGTTAIVAKAGPVLTQRMTLLVLPDSVVEMRAAAVTAAAGHLEALLRAANVVGLEKRLDPSAVRGDFDVLTNWLRGAVGTSVSCVRRESSGAGRFSCQLETRDRGTRTMMVEVTAVSPDEEGWSFWVVSLNEG
jgi:serine/threonine protein kinase